MNLYLISQTENEDYDTYDSAVVRAKSEDDARLMHPSGHAGPWDRNTWCRSPDAVTVEKIGTAEKGAKRGIVLASFNAG